VDGEGARRFGSVSRRDAGTNVVCPCRTTIATAVSQQLNYESRCRRPKLHIVQGTLPAFYSYSRYATAKLTRVQRYFSCPMTRAMTEARSLKLEMKYKTDEVTFSTSSEDTLISMPFQMNPVLNLHRRLEKVNVQNGDDCAILDVYYSVAKKIYLIFTYNSNVLYRASSPMPFSHFDPFYVIPRSTILYCYAFLPHP